MKGGREGGATTSRAHNTPSLNLALKFLSPKRININLAKICGKILACVFVARQDSGVLTWRAGRPLPRRLDLLPLDRLMHVFIVVVRSVMSSPLYKLALQTLEPNVSLLTLFAFALTRGEHDFKESFLPAWNAVPPRIDLQVLTRLI